MPNNPLVSVIIPIYNVQDYLAECLESVIHQTYTNLEIILINDGSSDASGEIARDFAKQDSRIIYFEQENKGGGAARNTGLAKATGEYVLLFDSDDYMRLDSIALLLERALQTNADITIAKSRGFDQNTQSFYDMSWALQSEYLPQKETFSYKDIPDRIFGFCVGWAWDKLYKAEFLRKHNLTFQEIRSSTDDLYFVFCSLVMTDMITYTNEVLFTHRTGLPHSLENSRDKYPLVFFEALKAWRETLLRLGIYPQVEKSFVNWTFDFCIWHLQTLKQAESKDKLYVALRKYMLRDLGIYDAPKVYFGSNYDKLTYIKQIPLWLHKMNKHHDLNTKNLFHIRITTQRIVIALFGYNLIDITSKSNRGGGR